MLNNEQKVHYKKASNTKTQVTISTICTMLFSLIMKLKFL